MVYTVYIDVVFAVNTIMDMMVLTILNRVLSYRTTKRRILAGAVIGGIWSCVVSLVPGLPAAVEILGTYVAVSSLMAVAAYHLKSPKEVIKSVAGIYLVSVVLGGVMLVLYEHTRAGYYAWLLVESGHGRRIPVMVWILMIAGAAAACYGFSGGIKELIRTMAHRKDLCRVTMIYGEKKETVTGLIDTGNRLREPAGPCGGGRYHEAAVSVGKGCGLCAVPVRGNQPRNSAGRVHRPDGDRAGGRQVQP